jgi:osmotically-inducible protein OsmY
MGYRDYNPGYRDREERDVERGRYGERGEQERYRNYGRERSDPEREYRGGWSPNAYDEGRNREFDQGSRGGREYGEYGQERGGWGSGMGRRGGFGSRERFDEGGAFEGRSGMENRGEYEGRWGRSRGGVGRDFDDRDVDEQEYGWRGRYGRQGEYSGGYETSRGPGEGRNWGVGGSSDISRRGMMRGYGYTGEYGGSWQYGRGANVYGESTGYRGSSGTVGAGQNFIGKGPRGYRRSSEAIRDEINERLTRHPDIDASDVEVRVEGSEVVLTGVVEDRRAKRLAEDIAEEVWGIDDVRNELKVRHGFLAKLTGEQADEREVSRTTSREPSGVTSADASRRTGRTGSTTGATTGGTSGT